MLNSCQEEGGPKEGELIYQISYVQDEDENPLIALLPKTITIRFKDDNTVAYIEGFFGTFQLRFINNSDHEKSYTVLRILDKKYISETSIDSLSAGYENFSNLRLIEHPEDTATFAGLLSYEVEVVCNKLSDSIIHFYYTNDLDIETPNSNSPFYEIEGVLTKFRTRVAGIDMIFELVNFNKVAVKDEEFLPPKDYKKVSPKELNEILQSFQE